MRPRASGPAKRCSARSCPGDRPALKGGFGVVDRDRDQLPCHIGRQRCERAGAGWVDDQRCSPVEAAQGGAGDRGASAAWNADENDWAEFERVGKRLDDVA